LRNWLKIIVLGLSITGFAAISCNNDQTTCSNLEVPPLKSIFKYATDKTPDSVVFIIPDIQDTLVNSKTMPSTLVVALNPEKDTTILTMTLRRKYGTVSKILSDSIIIVYKPELQLINLECGYCYAFKNLQVRHTDTLITSIDLLFDEVNQEKVKHVEISF
jgi:hypothetical protein